MSKRALEWTLNNKNSSHTQNRYWALIAEQGAWTNTKLGLKADGQKLELDVHSRRRSREESSVVEESCLTGEMVRALV
ncbi:unnamed protein product [Linum trigynum]|uniref:Uncharacterized protein n=1 Tax=Linum trigynum TaxID=586398 RepID=A0AAV2CAS3_9ROSI